MIYLDNAATTKPAETVIQKAVECMTDYFGNPSSLHKLGLKAELCIKQARKIIADSIGADPETILFTSGATESSNLALKGCASVYGRRNKKRIITSAVEHASVRKTLDTLEQQGFEVIRILPDENGRFQAEDFLKAIDENTFLISMMLVENETGRILPVQEVFRRTKKKYPDIILHCDAVQAYMKLPVKIRELQADLISFSAHKIHGIKGTGALYIKKGIRLTPLITGGEQEKAIRSGTEAVPSIAGFGEAVRILQDSIPERLKKIQNKRDYLINLLFRIPNVTINSALDASYSSPYILNFSVKGIRSETMLHYLEQKEIYVSSGSACSKGMKSGVLSAYHIPDELADCAIRVSFSEETAIEELYQFTQAVTEGQKTLIHKK